MSGGLDLRIAEPALDRHDQPFDGHQLHEKVRKQAPLAMMNGGAPMVTHPTFTGTKVMVSLPKMSITFTATV